MKERYETPELEIVEFNDEEILTDDNGYWPDSSGTISTKVNSTYF